MAKLKTGLKAQSRRHHGDSFLWRLLPVNRFRRSDPRARKRGVVIVYVTLGLIVFLGMAGLAVDVSHLHSKRAKVQRAADAAALAGAVQLALGRDRTAADTAARMVATANGYNTSGNATFTSTYPVPGYANWYQVRLIRTEPLFFMAALGFRNTNVGAPATALFEQPAEMGIYPVGQQYGATGRMNLSVFGPDARKSYGDAYSVRRHDSESAAFVLGASNGSANEDYTSSGYNFFVKIPSNFSSNARNNDRDVWVEVFDPDCYNNGGVDADGINRVDEIRPYGNYTTTTTTKYTLLFTNGTADTSDDIELGTGSYGGSSATDMQWVRPNGFQINLDDPRWGNLAHSPTAFRVNVQSTAGTSENGFLLRAGESRDDPGDSPTFNSNNGTSLVAQGKIPINFNQSGSVTVNLGYVPAGANRVTIDKFDTDVGAQSVTYNDGLTTYTGVLSLNAQHRADVFTLPANYPGRSWTATYNAGQQDTSSWSMYYSGPPNNQPGIVKLIR